MVKLNFAGQQGLSRGGAATHVDKVQIEAVLSKNSLFMSQPEDPDTGGERAVGYTNRRGPDLTASRGAVEQQTDDTNKQANPPSLLQLHLFSVHLFAAVACLMRAKFSRPTALTLVKKGRDGKYTSGYSNNRSG
jgi:hypothetical protein